MPLPADPAEVTSDPGVAEAAEDDDPDVRPALADAPVMAAQACYRPVTRDGLPLMGRVPTLRRDAIRA